MTVDQAELVCQSVALNAKKSTLNLSMKLQIPHATVYKTIKNVSIHAAFVAKSNLWRQIKMFSVLW